MTYKIQATEYSSLTVATLRMHSDLRKFITIDKTKAYI